LRGWQYMILPLIFLWRSERSLLLLLSLLLYKYDEWIEVLLHEYLTSKQVHIHEYTHAPDSPNSRQFHQHFRYEFFIRTSFFYVHVTWEKLPKRRLYKKRVCITLMKLTPEWWINVVSFSCDGLVEKKQVQSNLCTAATLWAPKLWPLMTGSRCVMGYLYAETRKRDRKIVVAVER